MTQWMLSILLWKIHAEATEMTFWAVSRAAVSHDHLEQTRVQPLTFEQFSDWLYSAFSFLKEWVGVGIFLACCLGGCAVCLWLVCHLLAQTRRDKVIVAQALAALECVSSPQVWLSALKSS